ncbi:MAG: hypothetical protein Q4C67_11530, partial [Deinococcus sp.]|nr:hypothetical protein [Deinococcus sp.]
TPAEGAAAAIRAEVESTPAYRAARLRYLEEATKFGTKGAQAAARAGAAKMHARRSHTTALAAERAARLMDGESSAAVFGIGSAA